MSCGHHRNGSIGERMNLDKSKKRIRPDIIEAATRLFAAHGYERATLDEIAAVVGMQKGSLYHHIDSKEQLLMAIHTELFHSLTSRLAKAVETAASDPIAELEQVILAVVKQVSLNRDAVRIVLRDRGSLHAQNSRAVEKNRAAILRTIESAVRRLCKAAGTPTTQTHFIAYGIMGMTYFVSEWVDPKHSADAIAQAFSRILIDGLSRPPAKARRSSERTAARATDVRASSA